MTTEREETGKLLAEMQRHIGRVNRPQFPLVDPNQMLWHNEQQQGEILRRWERIAALAGEHDTATEAGFEMGAELQEMPRSNGLPEERRELQEALRAVLNAADRINNPPLDPEDGERSRTDSEMSGDATTARVMVQAVDGPKTVPDEDRAEDREWNTRHNNEMRELLLHAWEDLAHALGHHILAIRMGREQPVVPFDQIRNSWEALGVAAFHAGSAELDYGLIRDELRGGMDLDERYQSGERDARISHNVLHWIHEELAHGEKNSWAPEIRKYARMVNVLMTRERAAAAEKIGVEPVPWETDCLQHHDIDHLQKRKAGQKD